MGWLLYRQGKHAEALQIPARKPKRLGNDPELDLHLGEVQWAVGRPGRRAQDLAGGARATIPTTKSSASGSSARGPERRRRHRACPRTSARSSACWRSLLAGCATCARRRAGAGRRARRSRRAVAMDGQGAHRARGAGRRWQRQFRLAAALRAHGTVLFAGRSARAACRSSRTANRSQIDRRRRARARRGGGARRACSSASGIELPLADMRYWMLGVPAPGAAGAGVHALPAAGDVHRVPAARLGSSATTEFQPGVGLVLADQAQRDDRRRSRADRRRRLAAAGAVSHEPAAGQARRPGPRPAS